jgi:hypothetical protein
MVTSELLVGTPPNLTRCYPPYNLFVKGFSTSGGLSRPTGKRLPVRYSEYNVLVVHDKGDTPEAVRKLAEIGSAGFAAGLTLAIFVVGGHFADVYLGTDPIFVLIGIVMGLVGSFYVLMRSFLGSGKGRGG